MGTRGGSPSADTMPRAQIPDPACRIDPMSESKCGPPRASRFPKLLVSRLSPMPACLIVPAPFLSLFSLLSLPFSLSHSLSLSPLLSLPPSLKSMLSLLSSSLSCSRLLHSVLSRWNEFAHSSHQVRLFRVTESLRQSHQIHSFRVTLSKRPNSDIPSHRIRTFRVTESACSDSPNSHIQSHQIITFRVTESARCESRISFHLSLSLSFISHLTPPPLSPLYLSDVSLTLIFACPTFKIGSKSALDQRELILSSLTQAR